jgi:YVTN family beta-propeller protein
LIVDVAVSSDGLRVYAPDEDNRSLTIIELVGGENVLPPQVGIDVDEDINQATGAVTVLITPADPEDNGAAVRVTQPSNGEVVVTDNGDGTFTVLYTPTEQARIESHAGTGPAHDTFTAIINDGRVLEAVVVTVPISPLNEAPSGSVSLGSPSGGTATVVLVIEATDPTDDELSVTISDPVYGTVTQPEFDSDSGYWYATYTPDAQSRVDAYSGRGPASETLVVSIADGEHTVTVDTDVTIDAAVAAIRQTHDLSDIGGSPYQVLVNPDNGHLYALIVRPSDDEPGQSNISVIDVTTRTVLGDAVTTPYGTGLLLASDMAISDDGSTVYVTVPDVFVTSNGNVFLGTTGTVTSVNTDGSGAITLPIDDAPFDVVTDPVTGHVYVPFLSPNIGGVVTATIHDVTSDTVYRHPYVMNIGGSGGVAGSIEQAGELAIGQDGTVYMTSPAEEKLVVFGADGTSTVPVEGRPLDIAVGESDGHVYVATYRLFLGQDTGTISAVVTVFDVTDGREVGRAYETAFTPSTADTASVLSDMVISPDGQRIFVSDPFSDSVVVMDIATGAVLERVAVGDGPNSLAFNADGSRLIVGNVTGVSITELAVATADEDL